MKSIRAKKLVALLLALLLVIQSIPLTVAHASNFTVLGVNYQDLNFSTATKVSGTDRAQGAIYKYTNIISKNGITVDAKVTIQEIKDAILVEFDGTTNPKRFEPTITSPTGTGYVKFKFDFFLSGTNTPVLLKDFYLTGADIDGSSTYTEYEEISGYSSYIVDQTTKLTISQETSGLTRFKGLSTSKNGIVFENTAAFIADYTAPISSLNMVLGAIGTQEASSRLFSLSLGSPGGNFTTPIVTKNPSSPTISLTIEDGGDEKLGSTDNLNALALTGTTTAEPGSTINLTLTDGTNTLTTTAVVQTGGTYTGTIDVTSLKTGTLTAKADVVNSQGNPAETAIDTTVKLVTVTFDSQGGNTVAPTKDVQPGTTISLPTNPFKTGYSFGGWNTDVTGTGTSFTASTPVIQDLTVFAQWTALEKYTVTFNSQGGNAVDPIENIISGSTVTLPAEPTKAGYTFAGWNTEMDATGSAFTELTPVTSNVTVYAQWTAIPVPAETTSTGKVVDERTGEEIQGVETKVVTEVDGTKTVSVKAQEAILLKAPNGTKSPLTDFTKIGFTTEENADILISPEGTIQIKGLTNGTKSKFNVTYNLGGGQKIVIGTIDVIVSETGDVNFVSTLIDPYGTITDNLTGEVIDGVDVVLYYADTERNRKSGKTPHTVVDLPIIEGFEPNDNKNPQISDLVGTYAFMVYPTSDYYIVATKKGYNKFISPTIPVENEIVKFDIKMDQQQSTISPNEVTFDKNPTKQTDVNITMKLNGNTLIKISNGDKVLVNGVDYEVNENIVTLKSSYLQQHKVGTFSLTFDFSAGKDQSLTVNVINTTKAVTTIEKLPKTGSPIDANTLVSIGILSILVGLFLRRFKKTTITG